MNEHELEKLFQLYKHNEELAFTLFKSYFNEVFNYLKSNKEIIINCNSIINFGGSNNYYICENLKYLKESFNVLVTDSNKSNVMMFSDNYHNIIKTDIVRCYNCNKPMSKQIKPTAQKFTYIENKINSNGWRKDVKFITYLYCLYNDFRIRRSYTFRTNFKHCVNINNKILKQI